MNQGTETVTLTKDHPLLKKYNAEAAAENLKIREKAAKELEALEEELRQTAPKLHAEVERTEAEAREAKAAFDKAAVAARQAVNASVTATMAIEHRKNRPRGVLLDSYDPRLDEAIEWFRDKHEKVRHQAPNVQTHDAGKDLVSLTKKLKTFSTQPAILTATEYCRQCIKVLEAMKLRPRYDNEAVERLKAEIPDTSEFTETSIEKPMDGSRGVNPLHLFPSDSQLAYEAGLIEERFQKIMRRKVK